MDLPVSAAELDYLAREREAADKSEYLNGTIVAKAGASREHNLYPVVIMEVLSPTTESLDRGEKLRSYQQTSSVREIVLISQHRRRVERYERQGGGLWLYEALEGEAAVLKLVSCGGEIPLGEFYDRIEL